MKVGDESQAEFRESSSALHPLNPPKPLSQPLVLVLLGDRRGAGGLQKFLRLHSNFAVDPTRRPARY